MKKTKQKILSISLILFGLTLFLYPDIGTWMQKFNAERYIRKFEIRHNVDSEQLDGEIGKDVLEKEDDPLYREILAYNAYIYETGQEDFRDTYSYTQMPVSLENLDTDEFGYIEIPAMDITLPLYAGASDKNMAKGAAILGQTSLPVGGTNTNSVIAGHRGWRGGSYFLEIENLSAGDMIYITNPWETLAYTVESIDVIDPYDCDAVRIQEGKDMVTLITCHPYLSHGKYRYVVYCVRDGSFVGSDDIVDGETDSVRGEKYINASDGIGYESSRDKIRQEKMLRRTGALVIMAITFMTFLYCRKQRKN